MKVVVLGGAGAMGAEAVRELASAGEVRKVIVADEDVKGGEALCESIGKKAEYDEIDALDHEEVVKVMKRGAVCLGCLGPSGAYEERMVSAALEAGVSYVSINDDTAAMEAVLAMDSRIRRAGICVLSGAGCTPGLSNVLAGKGIASLEKASRVSISFVAGAGDQDGTSTFRHLLDFFGGSATIRKDGKWKKVPAGSDEEKVEFPEPIGKAPVYIIGHPEPVTLPHFYSGLESVTMKAGIVPAGVGGLVRLMSRFRMADTVSKRDRSAFFVKFVAPAFGGASVGVSGLRVDVWGEKGGAPARMTMTVVDRMRRLTAAPAAVAAIMVGSGVINKKGFMPPGVAIDPDVFIQELSKRKVKVNLMINS